MTPTPIPVIGIRFGRLVPLREAEQEIRSYPYATARTRRVFCRCDCGQTTTVSVGHLRRGRVTSCGCLRREKTGAKNRTHGESGGKRTAEYTSWKAMRGRCLDLASEDFKSYGGRGITICGRWLHGENGRSGFECFLADMGRRPSKTHSIDREDNDGNYEPGNCRWATPIEQRRNQRRVVADAMVVHP